ncbi:MAG: hypothetical protein KDK28_01120 [Maritimibacter sp.]|nr:hypothetical protein [Maritimibacter sp.]
MQRARLTRVAILAALSLATPVLVGPSLAGDFEGAYVGAGLSAGFSGPFVPDYEGSAFIGYNWNFGSQVIVGSELDLTVNPKSMWVGAATTSTIDARLGFLASDAVMVYGRAGGGYTTGGVGSYVWDFGLGAEYMMNNGLSLRGEFDRVDPFEVGMDTQMNGRLGVVMNF